MDSGVARLGDVAEESIVLGSSKTHAGPLCEDLMVADARQLGDAGTCFMFPCIRVEVRVA